MTQNVMRGHWMTIGTDNKTNSVCTKTGRVKAGAKGIGRFALDKLFHNFFFQAEDSIRDADVTGVQTCALPICSIYSDISKRIKSTPIHLASWRHTSVLPTPVGPANRKDPIGFSPEFNPARDNLIAVAKVSIASF